MPSIIISESEVADTPKLKQKKPRSRESADDNNSASIYESHDTTQRKKNEKNKKIMVKENTESDEEEKKKKKDKKKNREKKRKIIDGSGSKDCETVKKVQLAVEEKEAEEEIEVEEDNANALSNFRISNVVKEKLKCKGISSLFPIQAMTYDFILDGSDLVGRARTGQGKTLAFVLPILESITNGPLKSSRNTGKGRTPAVVVLLPTRELAKQVHADFEFYGAAVGLSVCCVYGGASMHDQQNTLKCGVDITVGTPGRIKDLIHMNSLDLKALKFCVLDEADEMLNMGFADDVEFILGKVEDVNKVQTLFFSATMPEWVKMISMKFLKADKKTVDLVGNKKLKASASVRHLVMPCSCAARPQLIPDIIRCYSHGGRTIIFAETKESASELAGLLLGAHALHEDIAQSQREVILAGFREGKFLVLVAANVAACGLDINDVKLIIQCEPPCDVEAYIHHSGRTGRAGDAGISVLLYEPKYSSSISRIEREYGVKFEQISTPQPADVAESDGSEAADAISFVSDSVISIFKSQAERLLSTTGLPAIDLLAKALAKAAGYTDIKKRSLLSSMEGYVTVLLQAGRKPIHSPTFAYSILRRFLPEEKVEGIKGLSLTVDGMGAVFDVRTEDLDLFMDGKENASQVRLEIIEELPNLQEKEQNQEEDLAVVAAEAALDLAAGEIEL